MNAITFEQFQNSRSALVDLVDHIDGESFDAEGYIYNVDGSGIVGYIQRIVEMVPDCRDPDDPTLMEDISHVVVIGNMDYDFGDDLAAAEECLWNNWAAVECNWQLVRFDTEFGTDYQLDQQQVLKLLELGFEDTSWHNDICPSFSLEYGDDDCDRTVRIWFDAPKPEDREFGPDAKQFAVMTYSDGMDNCNELVETDNFGIAVAHALGAAADDRDGEDWGSERQIEAQNKFFIYVEQLVEKDEFEEIETYCLKATTPEMINKALMHVNRIGLTNEVES